MIKLRELDKLDVLVESFERDRGQTIREVYRCYRKPFLRYARRYELEEATIIDCFQESVIALYQNLVSHKITRWDSTIKTYLFAIGKNKLLGAIRKNRKSEPIDGMPLQHQENSEPYQEYRGLVQTAFARLSESCRDILVKFYYEKYSINAIMHEMDYKNENTVKAHKSRCLKKLRDAFKTIQTDS